MAHYNSHTSSTAWESLGDSELYAFLFGEKSDFDSAFREIYRRNSTRLYLYCKKILTTRESADDAFQETFAIFLRSYKNYPTMTNLPAFLLRIARNVCLRQKQISGYISTTEFNDALFSGSISPSGIEQEELVRLINLALDVLPDDQREALVLQAYQGLSYIEIAELMNVPVSSVRNWISRAKHKLRETLMPYWADYRSE